MGKPKFRTRFLQLTTNHEIHIKIIEIHIQVF